MQRLAGMFAVSGGGDFIFGNGSNNLDQSFFREFAIGQVTPLSTCTFKAANNRANSLRCSHRL